MNLTTYSPELWHQIRCSHCTINAVKVWVLSPQIVKEHHLRVTKSRAFFNSWSVSTAQIHALLFCQKRRKAIEDRVAHAAIRTPWRRNAQTSCKKLIETLPGHSVEARVEGSQFEGNRSRMGDLWAMLLRFGIKWTFLMMVIVYPASWLTYSDGDWDPSLL